jgi:hypothetical protein
MGISWVPLPVAALPIENSPPGIQAIPSGAGPGADLLFSFVARKVDDIAGSPRAGESEPPKLEAGMTAPSEITSTDRNVLFSHPALLIPRKRFELQICDGGNLVERIHQFLVTTVSIVEPLLIPRFKRRMRSSSAIV